MADLTAGLVRFVLRMLLLTVGLVVALSLFVAATVLALGFGARVLWARVTGRPITAWGIRIDPGATWRRFRDMPMRQRAGAAPEGPVGTRLAVPDIQDVEIKQPRGQ